jgi:serine/threonine-protein phosphatase 2A activator
MYNAEVLSKFPVIQHFPFGSLFAWEKDPNAKIIQASVHTSSQPKASTVPSSTSSTSAYSSPRPQPQLQNRHVDVRASHALQQRPQVPPRNILAETDSAATVAPWARPSSLPLPTTNPDVLGGPNQSTRAPWAKGTPVPPSSRAEGQGSMVLDNGSAVIGEEAGTRAPWATKKR